MAFSLALFPPPHPVVALETNNLATMVATRTSKLAANGRGQMGLELSIKPHSQRIVRM